MLSSINCFIFLFAVMYSNFGDVNSDPAKIDPDLLALLESGEMADVIVSFVNGIQPALDRAAVLRLDNRNDRNQAVVEELRAHADDSQRDVVQMLSGRSSGGDDAGFQYFKKYWLGNKVFIKQANAETVLAIGEDPKVLKIQKEAVIRIPETEIVSHENEYEPKERVKREPDDFFKSKLYALNITQVEAAWVEFRTKGEGVVIGHIDTGVMADHEALRDNWVGTEYGWFDGAENLTEPFDYNDHGTHTIGSAVAKFGIGVAPEAKWMTCRFCSKKIGCSGEACRDCIQWMACPTLVDGTNPDCSKAPQVVSNSWVTNRGSEPHKEEIMGWLALGIIPVFGIGNNGPDCNTTEPPGEFPYVIGVGASGRDDQMWSYSACGYASNGSIKPDIVAPGASIISTLPYKSLDDPWVYGGLSGTSMATPHVAGVVALLKSRDPDITYDMVYSFLTQNTDQTLSRDPHRSLRPCNETSLDSYPNNIAGYGRLNALKVAQAQTAALGGKSSKRCKRRHKPTYA